MSSQKLQLAKVTFSQGILNTFGKLDEIDIEQIAGNPERLLIRLMDRYEWSPSYAKLKVEEFVIKSCVSSML